MEKQNSQYQQIENYELLRSEVEAAQKKKLCTPKDFEFLRERIYARLHVLVSRTTLMRLWGYIEKDVQPRVSTLNIVSQFLGYQDWESFQENAKLPKEQQSSPVMSRKLSVSSDLGIGEKLRLTWQPGRVCDVEYLGNLSFKVIASVNTRIQPGDTFQCSLIVEGEPLYLDNLRKGDGCSSADSIAYVCGKKTGVNYEFLSKTFVSASIT